MQKEIEKQIKAELDKIKRKYLDSADEIFSDFNKEGQTAGDYNGRQIYKLLQNAEDAANGFGEVLIEFKKNKFSISNTGTPFDFDGVVSLLRSNSSSKKFSSNMIGQKGAWFSLCACVGGESQRKKPLVCVRIQQGGCK